MTDLEQKAREYAKSEDGVGKYDYLGTEYEAYLDGVEDGVKFALGNQWRDAEKEKPEHLQPCLCYNKFVGGLRIYVYDDISKYWCTQSTYEHDPDGDNHVVDYADRDVTHWMPLNWLPIPEYKPKGE